MLILQIILSVIAWFRGWKWYALIPLSVGIIITLLLKYFMINSNNALQMKLFASISAVVINLVLLFLCIIKKPIKSQKKDKSSGVMEDTISKNKIKQPKSEPEIVEVVNNEGNEVPKDNNEKESIGFKTPIQYIATRQYYYSKGRKKKGPFTEDELIKLELNPDTLIWTEGFDKWQPLSDFDGIVKIPPLPDKVLPYRTNPWKRIVVCFVLLVLLLGGSFISTYFIMESRRNDYMRLINDKIDQIFDNKTTLCEGKKYFIRGELRHVSEPIKSPDKSEYTYNSELEAYKQDIQTGAIERFHSEGKGFEYQKLIRRNSGFRVEELWSEDLVYFYEATVRYGSNSPRRLVTPEEAYESSYRAIIDENSECLTDGLSDKLNYLKGLGNRYFLISFGESGELSGGWRSTDYYRVYYERSFKDYNIIQHYSFRGDFIKLLSMLGGISILLTILLYILNPFKW